MASALLKYIYPHIPFRRVGGQKTLGTQGKVLLAVVAVLLASLVGCGGKEGRTVAIVNGQPLTRDAFYHALQRDYGRQGLVTAVLEMAAQQDAKKNNLSVSDAEIQKVMEDDLKQAGSKERLAEVLAQSGLTQETYRERLAFMLLMEKLLTKGVTVTEAEMKDYFEKNRARFDQPAQVKLRVIVTDAWDKADQIYKRLMSGADFVSVARESGTDPLARSGGDMGWRSRDSLQPPELAEQAFALRVGQISKPSRIGGRYWIVRVDDQKEAKPAKLEEVKDSVRRAIAFRKGEDINVYRDRLLGSADVEVLWPQYKALEMQLRALKPSGAGVLPPLEMQPQGRAPQTVPAKPPAKPKQSKR